MAGLICEIFFAVPAAFPLVSPPALWHTKMEWAYPPATEGGSHRMEQKELLEDSRTQRLLMQLLQQQQKQEQQVEDEDCSRETYAQL